MSSLQEYANLFEKLDLSELSVEEEGLKLTLEVAKDIVPEDEFYLRVNKDNPASLQVMLNNGGRIVGENDDKFFVRISNPDS